MTSAERHNGVRRVLLITLGANITVAVAKVVVGLLTGSLAMVADGFHSSLDSASNIVGLVGTAIAAQPPDMKHPYGHRRFETLASLLIAGMLLLTAWEIAKSSVTRLTRDGVPHITAVNFAVMAVTVLINLLVTVYEQREGTRLHSELLLADAEHTRSDVLVSLAVIAGLVAVRLGWAWMDAAVALVVVALIVRAAWRIVVRSAGILLDQAAVDPDLISRIAQQVPGVQGITRVRSRGASDSAHLDIDVQVAAPTTTEQSAAIAGEIRSTLRERFGGLEDIQVHFLPLRDGPRDYALIARAEADALGLGVHEVIPSAEPDGLILEMHVEVSPEQTVGEAHALVTRLEERLRRAIPDLYRVVTHIEPAHLSEHLPPHDEDVHGLARRALEITRRLYPDHHWHDLDIRPESDGGFALSMHCHVPPEMSLEAAHRLAETVETQIRAALPALHRVTIHTEPHGA